MSQQLISRSPDLQRLQNEGYDLEVRHGHLLINQIPYVNAAKEVAHGRLVTPLTLAGDRTARPKDHVVYFAGEGPCNQHGAALANVIHSSTTRDLANGLTVNHLLSSKPAAGYANFYDKMTSYVRMLAGPAQAIDPKKTATPFPVLGIGSDHQDSPFEYFDTASSRAGIGSISEKLCGGRIAIVGLGGTGSYILDLVAKTPVREIHLFDADRFLQHNAFRAPGAATKAELEAAPTKVEYFCDRYSAMHSGITAHPYFLTEETASELAAMHFVFLALDNGPAKRPIVATLESAGIPFIDTGMGLYTGGESIAGMVRVTTSTSEKRNHVHDLRRIPLGDSDVPDEYNQNIQVADLNALNAALAVLKWKKFQGFYQDLDQEHHAVFTIDGNHLLNEDNQP